MNKKEQSLTEIANFLSLAWSKETCYPKNIRDWSAGNPSCGQCAVSALVVQDFLGGRLAKIYVGQISHYFNIVNGGVIDLTVKQFGDAKIDYSNYDIKTRQQILSDQDTKKRYQKLKQKVEQISRELEKNNKPKNMI